MWNVANFVVFFVLDSIQDIALRITLIPAHRVQTLVPAKDEFSE